MPIAVGAKRPFRYSGVNVKAAAIRLVRESMTLFPTFFADQTGRT